MKYDSVTNIIILGEQCAGKTLFINNYLYSKTKTNNLAPTIGVDYYKKCINYQDNKLLILKKMKLIRMKKKLLG